MSIAFSNPGIFQCVDTAYRNLMSHVMAKPQTVAPTPFQVHRPLRVFRFVEDPGQARSCAGRMVISGRMADVCAELDRLIALENQGNVFSN